MTTGALAETHRILAIPTFQIQPAYRNRGFSDDGTYYQFRFEL